MGFWGRRIPAGGIAIDAANSKLYRTELNKVRRPTAIPAPPTVIPAKAGIQENRRPGKGAPQIRAVARRYRANQNLSLSSKGSILHTSVAAGLGRAATYRNQSISSDQL